MPRMLQNQDFKTLADLTGAGASASDLLNDDKIYIAGLSEQHSAALTNGDIVSKVLLTTKGDIAAGTGSGVAKTALGTNGYVLTADSTQTNGIKWAAVSTGTFTIQSKSANYTALNTDDAIICTGSSNFTITLYAASTGTKPLIIKNAGTGIITIARAGSDLIDNETSQTLVTLAAVTLLPDASSNFWIY